jgi:death-on-curing protein
MIEYIEADEIIALHEILLEEWGGDEGGGHRGALYEGVEAAVAAVKNSYYESVEELAAAYAVYIVQGHVFLDGNKRTGGMVMLCFLRGNGGELRVSVSRIKALMLELQARAESGEPPDRLIRWLASEIV